VARFRLTLEYAGTRYSGWQVQKNARTVAGEIARAVAELSGRRDFELYGAGRTDAGVHAVAQVAHLDLETRLAPEPLRLAINDRLPHDIHVLAVQKASRRWHARHSAVARCYLYQVSRRRTALAKPFVYWVKDPLDAARMRDAAGAFLGLKDFRAFAAGETEDRETRVLLDRIEVGEDGDLVLLRVRGSHFLWKMVRRLVGVLVEVGRGTLSRRDVERLLRGGSELPARLTAPPSGLFLERVFYEGEEQDLPLVPAIGVRKA
jgi:tRNA pseudouridine38-40 synthase